MNYKVSELIAELKKAQETYGDLPVEISIFHFIKREIGDVISADDLDIEFDEVWKDRREVIVIRNFTGGEEQKVDNL